MKSRNLEFMLITALLFISIILAAANYLDYLEFHIRVGPFFIHHWFSLIGSFYIGIYTPIYYYFKRKNPSLVRRLLMFHILGNVTSFGLISIHFTQQISRPAAFYPDLQTGIVLFPTVALLTLTGYSMKYRFFPKHWKTLRSIHVGLTTAFYVTIWVHILHGLGWINA